MTNYEKIKGMCFKDFNKFLKDYRLYKCLFCICKYNPDIKCSETVCDDGIEQYLESEAEEAEFAEGREEECLYCQKGKVLANGKTTDIGMAIYFVGRYTYLNAYGYNIHGDGSNTIGTKINYCPMCGRRLSDD